MARQRKSQALLTKIAAETAQQDSLKAAELSAAALGVAPDAATQILGLPATEEPTLVRFANMLPLTTVLEHLIQTVRDEHRRDVTVPIPELRVDPTSGRLSRKEKTGEPLRYTRRAFIQLMQRMPSHPNYAGQYLTSIPPLRRHAEFANVVSEPRNKDSEAVLRLRMLPGERHHIFATVAKSYTSYDPDQMADDLLDACKDIDVKGVVYYRGISCSVAVIQQGAVGSIGAEIVARVSSADDTTEAVKVTAEMWLTSGGRYCGGHAQLAKAVHKGDRSRFLQKIRGGINRVNEAVQPWLALWQAKTEVAVPNGMENAIAYLCGADESCQRKPLIRSEGCKPLELAKPLLELWEQIQAGMINEMIPEESQANLCALLLRSSATQNWADSVREMLEGTASYLLSLTPSAFHRAIGIAQSEVGGHAENAELANRLLAINARAEDWSQTATELREEGDEEGAEVAAERAELYLVEHDLEEERNAK